MSSKKKAQKEKDDAKAIKCQAFLLESDKAALIKSNGYPLNADAISIGCGRPYGALDPLDWTASQAWLDEVPPLSILDDIRQYANNNLRSAKNNTLPADFPLLRLSEDELAAFPESHWTRRELFRQWNRDVVHRLGSLTLYPKHSVSFTYAVYNEHCSMDCSRPAFTLASVIRRLLNAHCEWSNHPPAAKSDRGAKDITNPADAYRPVQDFQKLIGHSIRCTGFVTALEEQKDVTFNYAPSPPRKQNADEDDEIFDATDKFVPPIGSGERKLTLTSHYNSTYINVCCGKNFYQLPVLDTEKRAIKPLSALSVALDLIYEDARARELSLNQLNVSDEVREDLSEFYSLLARMTATSDDVDGNIHRRLCEVSEVNTYNLEQLEGALFTVVIDGPIRPGMRNNEAQWLHSAFSLYYQWEKPHQFYATSFAVVSADTLQLFLKKALGGSSRPCLNTLRVDAGRCLTDQQVWTPHSRPDSSEKNKRESPTPTPSFMETSNRSPTGGTPVAERPFQVMELWLPQKHRTALRPYPPICPTHQWTDEWFQYCLPPAGLDDLSVAHFCAAVVLAVERVLFSSGEGVDKARRPSVKFAYHHPQCTVPSVVSLLTREMEAFIQAVRSPSALINPIVRRTAEERGIRSVAERLQECIDTPCSFYGLSRAALGWCEEEVADVCITFGYLSHEFQRDNGTFQVHSTGSDLGIPARLLINGTAEQVFPQKHLLLGEGAVRRGELGVAPGSADMADAFSAAFSEELLQMNTRRYR